MSGDGLCARPCVMHCAEGRSSAVFFPLFNIANLFTQPLLSLLTRSWQKHERCKEGEVSFPPLISLNGLCENSLGWPVENGIMGYSHFEFLRRTFFKNNHRQIFQLQMMWKFRLTASRNDGKMLWDPLVKFIGLWWNFPRSLIPPSKCF